MLLNGKQFHLVVSSDSQTKPLLVTHTVPPSGTPRKDDFETLLLNASRGDLVAATLLGFELAKGGR